MALFFSFFFLNPRTVAVAASWLVDGCDSDANVQALLLLLDRLFVLAPQLFYTLLAEPHEVDHLLIPLKLKFSGKKWDGKLSNQVWGL